MATGLFPDRTTDAILTRRDRVRSSFRMPGRLVRNVVLVGSGSVVCQVLGTVTALAMRVLMDPALVGVWSGLKVFLSYGNLTGLGASKAAAREIALETARGNHTAAERSAQVALTVNSITSVLTMLGLFAAAAWMRATATGPFANYWVVGLAAIGVFVPLSRYSTFLITVLRAKQQFGTTTRLALFEAALTLAVTVVGVWLWGLYGLFASTLVVMVGGILFLHFVCRTRVRFQWDGAEAKRLVAIGAPILAGGLTLTLLRSVDKLMILAYLPEGEYALGCYSLGLMATAGLMSLANVLGIVSFPRYQVRYGRTGDARDVARLAMRMTEASALALSVVFLMAALIVPPMLAWLLPAYRDGLPALLLLLPGVLLLCLARPGCHYLITVGKQTQIVWVVVAAVLVAVAANHVALSAGMGITGVAVASTASYAFYAALLGAVAYGPFFSRRSLMGFLFRCSAPVLLAAGTFALWIAVSRARAESLFPIAILGSVFLVLGWSLLWRTSRDWRHWLWQQ